MRAIAILFSGLGACLLPSCTTPTRLNPDVARTANASIEKNEALAARNPKKGKPPELLLRVWGDRPEYVSLLRYGKNEGKGPRLVSAVAPGYPLSALVAQSDAKVVVAIVISEKGKVEAARIIESSDQRFDASSLRAAKQFKFLPALKKDGTPEKHFTFLPFKFVQGSGSPGR